VRSRRSPGAARALISPQDRDREFGLASRRSRDLQLHLARRPGFADDALDERRQPCSRSWQRDRLIAMRSPSRPAAAQAAACAQAVRRTHSRSARSARLLAIGMNSMGSTRPSSGWRQRRRASAPRSGWCAGRAGAGSAARAPGARARGGAGAPGSGAAEPRRSWIGRRTGKCCAPGPWRSTSRVGVLDSSSRSRRPADAPRCRCSRDEDLPETTGKGGRTLQDPGGDGGEVLDGVDASRAR